MKKKKWIAVVLLFFIMTCLMSNTTVMGAYDNHSQRMQRPGPDGTWQTWDPITKSWKSSPSSSEEGGDPTLAAIESGMQTVNQVESTNGSIGKVLNAVIKLIQIAGSGIAVIVVTMLGVKYMLASSSEKADIKKQAMPVVIGCVVLFAAVNLVAIIADVGSSLN